MLAITLAMMTTLLTLGLLVFSTTQAISSFGIVLVSGIFTAFLLARWRCRLTKRTYHDPFHSPGGSDDGPVAGGV